MKTKLAFILGATLLLAACDRHPDTVAIVPQQQPAYVQDPRPVYVQQPQTVIVERDHSGDVASSVAAGMVMGHLLSHSYGGYSHTYSPTHTVINNTYVSHTSVKNTSVNNNTSVSRSYTTPSRSYSRSPALTVNHSYTSRNTYRSPFAKH